MDERIKNVILQALDTEEARLKRAINTTNKPVFIEVYKTDLASIAYARAHVESTPMDVPGKKG